MTTYSQDGGELILIHSYTNKAAIDNIANPIEGTIAYNTADNSIYLYDGTNWIADCFSKSITTTTGAGPLVLDENFHTVIIADDTHIVELPPAGDHNEREYVLKNINTTDVTITGTYLDNTNMTSGIIPAENVLKIQSDGTNWNQVNNYSGSSTSSTGNTSTNCLNPNPPITFSTESTNTFSNFNYRDVTANGQTPELRFGYQNPLPSGSTANITEIQIIIRDVTYEILTPQASTYDNIQIPLSNITITSGESISGTPFKSDHIITITGINLPRFRTLDFNFSNNKNGFDTGGSTCTGCSIEYYTN